MLLFGAQIAEMAARQDRLVGQLESLVQSSIFGHGQPGDQLLHVRQPDGLERVRSVQNCAQSDSMRAVQARVRGPIREGYLHGHQVFVQRFERQAEFKVRSGRALGQMRQ